MSDNESPEDKVKRLMREAVPERTDEDGSSSIAWVRGVGANGGHGIGIHGNNNRVHIGNPSTRVLVDLPRDELHWRRSSAVAQWRRFRRRERVSWQSGAFIFSLVFLAAALVNMAVQSTRGNELVQWLTGITVIQWLLHSFWGLGSPFLIFVGAAVSVVLFGVLDHRNRIYCRDQMWHLEKRIEDIDAALRQRVD